MNTKVRFIAGKCLGASIDDIHLHVPIEHLKLFAGEYLAVESEKKINYAKKDGMLVRDYGDRTVQLIPLENEEFIYLDKNIHVRFDATNPGAIILKVPVKVISRRFRDQTYIPANSLQSIF
ncbi:MAG: hypothetical protein ACI85F_002786 [Bacteroidia bacterium]|jgi:hypothetical protein